MSQSGVAKPVEPAEVFDFERPYQEASANAIKAIGDLFRFVVGEPTGRKDVESAKSIAISGVSDLKQRFQSLVDLYRGVRKESVGIEKESEAVEARYSELLDERDHLLQLSTILMQCIQDLADGHDPKTVADRVALYEVPRMLDLALVLEKIPARSR